MSQVNISSYMDRIRTIARAACTATSVHKSRSKRDKIEDARMKVARKLRLNKAYFLDPVNNKRPDSVYKEQIDGTFAVGIKYCQRYLGGVFDGETFIREVQAAELADLLELFAVDAESGLYDKQISVIMKDNAEAASKRRRA